MMSGMPTPNEQVNGPATGLAVTAILGFVVQGLGILANVFGFAFTQGLSPTGSDAALNFFSGTIGIAMNVIAVGVGVVVLVGAQKMKRLESHGFAMAASILALNDPALAERLKAFRAAQTEAVAERPADS